MSSEKLILDNSFRRAKSVVALFALAKRPGVSTTAKSGYYRAGSMLLASVAEGLIFCLIMRGTGDRNPVIYTEKIHKNIHRLPKGLIGTKEFLIVREEIHDIKLRDRGCTFNLMIEFCKTKSLLNKKEIKRIRYVQKKRNQIHVQGLAAADTGYTKLTINLMSECIRTLILKLLSLPPVPSSATP